MAGGVTTDTAAARRAPADGGLFLQRRVHVIQPPRQFGPAIRIALQILLPARPVAPTVPHLVLLHDQLQRPFLHRAEQRVAGGVVGQQRPRPQVVERLRLVARRRGTGPVPRRHLPAIPLIQEDQLHQGFPLLLRIGDHAGGGQVFADKRRPTAFPGGFEFLAQRFELRGRRAATQFTGDIGTPHGDPPFDLATVGTGSYNVFLMAAENKEHKDS